MTLNSVLPPPQPGIRTKTLSESHQGCTLLNKNKSLSASTLQERVKTPCVQSLQEREKTPCVQSLQEREKTPCVQPQNVFIPDQFFKLPSQELEVALVGGRLRRFLPEWQKQKTHQSILSLIQDGYKLPFRECPKLSRFPYISSGYAGSDRQNALLTSIQDLLQKGAIEVVHTKNSLGFYSRLFLVPKPGNRWRPVIDLSSLNKFLAIPKFKMETPVNMCLPQERRMGYIHRFDRRLPTCPYSYPVAKVPQVLPQRRHLPIYQPPIRPSHGPIGFHKPCERSQAYSPTTGNQTTPIFGLLVDSSSFQTGLHRTNTKTTKTGERPRICSKLQEVRTHTLSEVRLPRVPFFTGHGSCEAHARQVDKASGDVPSPLSEVCYQCKDSYVHHWIACINGEDCKTGQDSYETISVASQNSLEISDASGHTNPLESEDDMTRGMVVRPSKRATRRVSPPKGTQNSNLYRRLKRRMGRSLKSRFYRRALVSTRKTPAHQSFRTEGSFSGSTILQKELQQQLSPHSLRQHLSGVIHQQTGRNKISGPMLTDLENSYLVPQQQGNTQSKARPGLTQCYRGRPLQEEPDPVNRVVPFASNIQENLQNMPESPSGPVCNQPEQKAPPLCLSDSRPSGLGSRCPEHPMGKPGCICLSCHCPA